MLAVVAPEAHDDPLSPLFEAQKQAAAGINNYVTHFHTQGYIRQWVKGAGIAGMSLIKHSVPK